MQLASRERAPDVKQQNYGLGDLYVTLACPLVGLFDLNTLVSGRFIGVHSELRVEKLVLATRNCYQVRNRHYCSHSY